MYSVNVSMIVSLMSASSLLDNDFSRVSFVFSFYDVGFLCESPISKEDQKPFW